MKQLEGELAFDPTTRAHFLRGRSTWRTATRSTPGALRMAADRAARAGLPQEALAGLGAPEDHGAQGRADSRPSVQKAIEAALLASSIDPRFTAAYVLHAEAAEASGEASAAISSYQKVLELEPKNAEAAAALARLGAAK